MGVTFTHLTTGSDTTNQASYTTASFAPAADRILYAAVFATAPSGGVTPTPTLTGTMGLTWELVRQAPATNAIRTLFWFRAATSSTAPSPGTLTFDFGGYALTGAMWMVYEAAGADMSGTNGAGATVQSVEERRTGGTNTSVSFPFPNTVDPANGTLAVVGITAADQITPGTGWSAPGGTTTYSSPNQALTAMHSDAAVQTIAASWVTGANTWVIGVEVKAASAATSPSFSDSLSTSGSGTLALSAALPKVTASSLALTGFGSTSLASARVATSGSLSLSGTGGLSLPAGRLAVNGSLTLSGSGTTSLSGKPGWSATLLLAADGQMALSGAKYGFRGSPLDLGGSGALSLAIQSLKVGPVAFSLGGSSALALQATGIAVPKTGSIAVQLSGGSALVLPAGSPGFTDIVALEGGSSLTREALTVVEGGTLAFTGVGHLILADPNRQPYHVFTTDGVWRPIKYVRVWNGRDWLPVSSERTRIY